MYSDHDLRRVAEELQNELQAIPNTNRVWIVGGRPRKVRVELDGARLAARQVSPLQVVRALRASNVNRRAGDFEQQDEQFIVDAGEFVADVKDLERLVIQIADHRPVYLQDVATILDGPAESETYTWIGFGAAESNTEDQLTSGLPASASSDVYPAVHIAVAKRKGTNAVWVAKNVERRLEELSETHFPSGMHFRITRDYGETANDKVNELVEGLAVAVLTVIGLIGLTLGWRPALVVAMAIPVCYSLTLFINLLAGYTINRVTMFALILSLGLLVDDPITDVENIARYFAMRILPPRQSVLKAVQEVRPALLLSTLAIIASFLPLAFITGMMGPYMAPMALNVPLTVTVSTVVAFVLTPWLAMVALRSVNDNRREEAYDLTRQPLYRFFNAFLGPILDRRWLSWATLGLVGLLLIGAMVLPALRLVPLKMLPYDNKNEFQVVIDMPEGTTLERTDAVARQIGRHLAQQTEVRDYEVFVGTASPMDFNGMVRHYFLRRGAHVADIRVNLADKDQRVQQSHEIVLRIRNELETLAQSHGANVKVVEVPPGPPVIATVTAEVYGPVDRSYDELIQVGRSVANRLRREPGIVDVDISAEDEQTRWVFVTDKPKAALSGVSTDTISRTLQLALAGMPATVLHVPNEIDPLYVELRLPIAQRSAIDDLQELYVQGDQGQVVQLGALGRFERRREDKTIYHKNLERVVYVYGEVAGRSPAEAIIDMQVDRMEASANDGSQNLAAGSAQTRPAAERTWFAVGGNDPWSIPHGYTIRWAGEGEWKITLDVFRDLGLAFGAALLGIFIILMFQTGSRLLPMVIMLAIPLTLIGIMPGFWLLNVIVNRPIGGHPNPVFFTATAMIGMIALAGIVVRNSVVLIDFIHMAQAEGIELREAIIRSVAVRTRPILLTAGTTLLGNWVITLDPIFSGLAWAVIFGIMTSTLFTLLVIPVVYWLLYRNASVGNGKEEASAAEPAQVDARG